MDYVAVVAIACLVRACLQGVTILVVVIWSLAVKTDGQRKHALAALKLLTMWPNLVERRSRDPAD